jgi:hypothetical protein
MVTYSSNLEQLAEETRPGIVRMDGPSAAGGGATVGDRLSRELAARIHDRGAEGFGTDGAWKRNADSTVDRKGFDAPNIVTGEMLDPRHIAGEVDNQADAMEMTYGTGDVDGRGTSDRDRAHFAETGQSRQKIVRSFFGLVDGDMDAAAELLASEWDAAAGGGGAGLPAPAAQAALPALGGGGGKRGSSKPAGKRGRK